MPTFFASTRPVQRFLALLLLVSLLLAACSPHQYKGTPLNPPKELYDLTGTNWNGNEFRLSAQQGRVVIVFFGYTFCPDVCPLTLAEMVQLRTLLGDKAEQVDMVFVSVDPERDTVQKLSQYIPAFHPNFYGLHIPAGPELETAKFAFGAWAEKSTLGQDQSSVDYLVDHTAWLYVVNQEGKLHEIFSFESTAEDMLPDILYILKRG